MLVGCKVSLTHGRYTWRHYQVLKCLASVLENKRTTLNAITPATQPIFPQTAFIQEGEKQQTNASPSDAGPLDAGRDWEMCVNQAQRLNSLQKSEGSGSLVQILPLCHYHWDDYPIGKCHRLGVWKENHVLCQLGRWSWGMGLCCEGVPSTSGLQGLCW